MAGAGSYDGWRGADCWFVAAPGSAPVPVGTLRPATALGELDAPLASGSCALFDRVNRALVRLVNPSMILETVDDARLFSGANRAMVGRELLQFGQAEAVGPGLWRLSRLLRGRSGTEGAIMHGAGAPFVLLDDPAMLMLPGDLASVAEGAGATLQWASRNEMALTEVDVPGGALALQPLPPVHGWIRRDGAGGMNIGWVRRSRVDTGWRDHVDLPVGEGRAAWRVAVVPAVVGVGPWECETPELSVPAATMASVPPGRAIEIRQIGDFALSQPLALPLT